MKKKIIILSSIFITSFVLGIITFFVIPLIIPTEKTTKTSFQASYPYRTKSEVLNDSNLIIRAKAKEKLPSKYANPDFELGEDIPNFIVTDVLFDVIDVYKGEVDKSKPVTVRIEGGKVEVIENGKATTFEFENPSMPNFKIGDEVILVLAYPRGAGDRRISSEYYVFNPLKGVYFPEKEKDGNITYKAAGSDETLKLSTIQTEIDAAMREN